MFQSSNPVLEFFWYMFVFYLFFMVIWMFIQVFADIFRRENLSGWGKAGWILLIFIVPFLGILDLHDRASQEHRAGPAHDRAEAQGDSGAARRRFSRR